MIMAKKKTVETVVKKEMTPISDGIEVNPDRAKALLATCDKVGATRDKLVDNLFKLTTAKKLIIDKYGEEHWEDDFPTQLRANTSLLEVRGDILRGNGGVNVAVGVSVQMSDKERELIEAYRYKDRG